MSGILSNIGDVLKRLFRNFLPSWDDPSPVSPELFKPSELPVLEKGSKKEEEEIFMCMVLI